MECHFKLFANECIYVIILLILFDYIIFKAIFDKQNITL